VIQSCSSTRFRYFADDSVAGHHLATVLVSIQLSASEWTVAIAFPSERRSGREDHSRCIDPACVVPPQSISIRNSSRLPQCTRVRTVKCMSGMPVRVDGVGLSPCPCGCVIRRSAMAGWCSRGLSEPLAAVPTGQALAGWIRIMPAMGIESEMGTW
jgi:hypothetical protein